MDQGLTVRVARREATWSTSCSLHANDDVFALPMSFPPVDAGLEDDMRLKASNPFARSRTGLLTLTTWFVIPHLSASHRNIVSHARRDFQQTARWIYHVSRFSRMKLM
jgi:hypothetical protein